MRHEKSAAPLTTNIFDGARVLGAENPQNFTPQEEIQRQITAGNSNLFNQLAPLAMQYFELYQANASLK